MRCPSRLSLLRYIPLAVLLWACGGGDGTTEPPPPPPSVSLASTTLTLAGLGSEGTLTASPTPSQLALTWTSEQPSVATVSGSGTTVTVRAVSAGTATIVASVNRDGQRAEARATVTVTPVVRNIALTAPVTRVTTGATVQFTAAVTADEGAATTLTWTTSAPAIASVNATGLVTTLAPGSVIVRATSVATPAVTGELTLAVDEPPRVRSITITPAADSALVGQQRSFAAEVTADSGASTATTWRSSDPAVATVSAQGLATAVSPGTATLTVLATSDTTVRAAATFAVRAPTVHAITVTAPNALLVGGTGQAAAAVTADAGVATTVTWSSTAPAVATVDSAGTITAVAAGTTTIRATSTAAPAVTGDATLTVSAPPGFLQWTRALLGGTGGQMTDGLALDLVSLNASRALAVFWAFGDGNSPYHAVSVQNLQVTDVSPPAGAGMLLTSLTAVNATEAFAITESTRGQVFRWTAAANWTRLPVDPPGPPHQAQALGDGRVAVGIRSGTTGTIYRWNGTTWDLLHTRALPANTNQTHFHMISDAAGVYVVTTIAGTYQVSTWNGSTSTTLPPIPGAAANASPRFVGNALDNLYAFSWGTPQLFRWNGSSWSTLTAGLPTIGEIGSLVMCNGAPLLSTTRGRVFRWTGTTFEELGNALEALPDRWFGSSRRPVSCASDGTIRVAGGDGSIARWMDGFWLTESYLPSLRAVRLVSPTLGWAAGGGFSLYRWNGTAWTSAFRFSAFDDNYRRIGGIAAWPDGRMIAALWSNIAPAGIVSTQAQGALLHDGSTWAIDTSSTVRLLNDVWGTSYANTFGVTGNGRVLRFDGTTWTPVFTGSSTLHRIGGAGDTFALAIGPGLSTVRWNGTAWSEVSGATTQGNPSAFHVDGVNSAWASVGTALYRFSGTAWSAVNVSDAGGATSTWALFGTGPNDVYAVRGPSDGARLLYRWDGTAWSPVTGMTPGDRDFIAAGSAVPGLAVMVGNAGVSFRSTTGAGAGVMR